MNPSKQVVVTSPVEVQEKFSTTPVEVQEKFYICQACDSTINVGESKNLRKMNLQLHKNVKKLHLKFAR